MQPESFFNETDDPSTLEKILKLQTKNMHFDYIDEHFWQLLLGITMVPIFTFPYNLVKCSDLNVLMLLHVGKIMIIQFNYFGKTSKNSIFIKLIIAKEKDSNTSLARSSKSYQVSIFSYIEQLTFQQDKLFMQTIKLYINPKYVEGKVKNAKMNKEIQNWFMNLYMKYLFLISSKNDSEEMFESIQFIRNSQKDIISHSNYEKVKRQNKWLKSIFENQLFSASYIDSQIKEMTKNLKKVNNKNMKLMKNLEEKVSQEWKRNQLLFVLNENFQLLEEWKQEEFLMKNIEEIESLKKYLKIQIRKLERRQVAQSMAKIIQVERKQNDFFYTVLFEESMGLGQIIMDEKQLLSLQKQRESSFFDGYQCGQKSRYGFMCSNLVGFREIYQRKERQQHFQIEKFDMFEEMKKQKKVPKKIIQKFRQFSMCHHCQALLQEKYLKTCKKSFKQDQSTFLSHPSQLKIITKKRQNCNSYQNYSIRQGTYRCQRKYCLFCIKLYGQKFDKNGICFFCQDKCTCKRCLRQDLIKKLRRTYLQIGGYRLQDPEQKYLKMNHQIEAEDTFQCDLSDQQTMILTKNLKKQMNRIQVLISLVKRREKKKYKLIESKMESTKIIARRLGIRLYSNLKKKSNQGQASANQKQKQPVQKKDENPSKWDDN